MQTTIKAGHSMLSLSILLASFLRLKLRRHLRQFRNMFKTTINNNSLRESAPTKNYTIYIAQHRIIICSSSYRLSRDVKILS